MSILEDRFWLDKKNTYTLLAKYAFFMQESDTLAG